MIDILPAVGTVQDFETVAKRVLLVAPYTSWIHIDIADNTLVQNETFRDFSRWKELPNTVAYEAHLMVANPKKYIRTLVDAGFKRLIAHVESEDPRGFLEAAEYEEVEVGLALDGNTEVEMIEPFLEEIDTLMVMGYEAGFSGQQFQLETVEKIRQILYAYPETLIEVDGGVNDVTAKLVVEAGAKRLAVTSYLFQHPSGEEIAEKITRLQNLA